MTDSRQRTDPDVDTDGDGDAPRASVTPEREHRGYPGLNALRAVGATMVVATHTGFDTGRVLSGWTGAVITRMDFGVAIFFVLSGFLLSRPFLLRAAMGQPAPSVRHYLWKRALRILPLYWVVVTAVAVVEPGNGYMTGQMWLRTVTLTQLYHPDLLALGLTHMWTLATEAAFYVVLPLVCMALVGRHGRWQRGRLLSVLGALALLGIGWQSVTGSRSGSSGHYAQWLPGYLPWFAIGLFLAGASVADQTRRDSAAARLCLRLGRDPLGCWLVAILVFGIACTPLAGPRVLTTPTAWEAGLKCVLYGVSSGLLVLPLVFGPLGEHPIRRFCNHRVPFFLGEISYGIFCIHLFVLDAVLRQPPYGLFRGHFLEVLVTTLAITLALATVAHYVVERPFLRLKDLGPFGRESGRRGRTAASEPTSRT